MKLYFPNTLPLLFVLSLIACKQNKNNTITPEEEVVYISDAFLTDDNTSHSTEDVTPVDDNSKKFTPQAINVSGNSAEYFKNYQRQSDAPEEFAKATLWHAVRMVYTENFSAPQIKVLDAKQDDGKLILSLQISWRDRWVQNPYVIKGNLTVNPDGSNGTFLITSKNLEAEALEVTNPQTKNSAVLPTI